MSLDYTTADKYTLYNLDEIVFPGEGPFDIPIITPEPWVDGLEFIGFNYARTATNRDRKGVHFFLDDYQFDLVWHNWKRYGLMLSQFEACMTPDFSMYTDWPVAVQIWNHYRKHFVGAYLQTLGVRVYPSICWSDEKSLDWCFDGEPAGGCVAVSSVGTQRIAESKKLFKYGFDAMLERLHPETIIFYGDVPDDCKGNIVQIKPFHKRFNEARIAGW